jgi:hypothetical protein
MTQCLEIAWVLVRFESRCQAHHTIADQPEASVSVVANTGPFIYFFIHRRYF